MMEFTLFFCFIPFWSILILFNPVWYCFLEVVFLNLLKPFKLHYISWNLLYFCNLFHFNQFWSCLILFDPFWKFYFLNLLKPLNALHLIKFTLILCFIPFWSILKYFITKLFFNINMANSLNSIDFTTIN